MKRRRWLALALATSALPCAVWAAEPAVLLLEWRWVTLSAPAGAGLHSQGQVPGTHAWGTRAAGDAVEPFGPALRLLVGERAHWTLEHDAPVAWALRRPGGVPITVPVPLNAPGATQATPANHWQLEAQASWPARRGPVQLQLRWQGNAETIATTVRAAPGRWTAVAQRTEGSAAAPEPGVLRSSAAAPSRTRELQVRVTPILE